VITLRRGRPTGPALAEWQIEQATIRHHQQQARPGTAAVWDGQEVAAEPHAGLADR
jgi:hypothetical protein